MQSALNAVMHVSYRSTQACICRHAIESSGPGAASPTPVPPHQSWPAAAAPGHLPGGSCPAAAASTCAQPPPQRAPAPRCSQLQRQTSAAESPSRHSSPAGTSHGTMQDKKPASPMAVQRAGHNGWHQAQVGHAQQHASKHSTWCPLSCTQHLLQVAHQRTLQPSVGPAANATHSTHHVGTSSLHIAQGLAAGQQQPSLPPLPTLSCSSCMRTA
jgi:hypothetical protein